MKVILWGGRSTARLVQNMLGMQDIEVAFIYDASIKELSFGTKARLLQSESELLSAAVECTSFVICIGGEHGLARYQIMRELMLRGLEPVDVVSPHSYIDSTAQVGRGVLAMPGSIVHAFTRMGDAVTVNSNACVDHECDIGHGVHIMGSAALAGRVKVGNYATIGTNATVLPDLTIGEGAYVGAGAVVTEDVGSNQVVAGVPAAFVRDHVQSVTLDEFRNWLPGTLRQK